MTPVNGVLGCLVAYVAGSFPSAYIAGRAVRGIDLRTVGSGNLGATNVYRELGAVPAIVVLLLDVLKGGLSAGLIPGALRADPAAHATWGVVFGVSAIAGHAKPVFLLWRGGGKGVATAAGVFGAVAPLPLAGALVVFAAVVAATRFVSLASIVAAATLPALIWMASGQPVVMGAGVAVAAFVLWSHRANLRRLRAGTEPRIGRPGGTKS